MAEWISVKERLPELHTPVATRDEFGYYNIAYLMYGNEFHVDGEYDPDIRWWTPLPEPPKEEVEVKHGEWLEKETFHDENADVISEWQSARCSVCNKYNTTPYLYCFTDYNFCPNCGADMRGGI